MASRLQSELKQRKPFTSLEVEAYLNLARTADRLSRAVEALLSGHDLTQVQYNVLRILRGAEPEGLPCGEVAARLVTHDPDVTRLLDRLERRELVLRSRSATDRRQVWARITPAGLTLLAAMTDDESLDALHRRQFAPLSRDELSTLIRLLEAIRPPDAPRS